MNPSPTTPPKAPRRSSHEVPGVSPQPETKHDPFYGNEVVARTCARFITHLFECPEYPPATTFPQSRLPHFIAYALHRAKLHHSVTYAALILLQRLKSRFPTAKGSSGHRLFISALMIASKVICDDTYSNKSWCIVAQKMFSLWEVNQMEREMCSYLDWELTVDVPTLSEFTDFLEKNFSRDRVFYAKYHPDGASKRNPTSATASGDNAGESHQSPTSKPRDETSIKTPLNDVRDGNCSPVIGEKGVHYIITHNTYYGPVNNVGHITKATFLSDESSKVGNTSSPPNSFIIFGSGLARARYSSESVNLSHEAASDIVLATWDSFSPEDQAKIIQEAEEVERLHSARLGTEELPPQGEAKKGMYWNFAGQITDFWLKKWNQAQEAVKKHFKTLGKELLLLPVDFITTENSLETTSKGQTNTPASPRPVSRNKSTGWRAFRSSKHSPGKVPHPPSILERLFERFGTKNVKDDIKDMATLSATHVA